MWRRRSKFLAEKLGDATDHAVAKLARSFAKEPLKKVARLDLRSLEAKRSFMREVGVLGWLIFRRASFAMVSLRYLPFRCYQEDFDPPANSIRPHCASMPCLHYGRLRGQPSRARSRSSFYLTHSTPQSILPTSQNCQVLSLRIPSQPGRVSRKKFEVP